MAKRWKRVILLACGLLALGLLWQVLRDREPSYQGRTLSDWVKQVGPAHLWNDSDEEVKAISAISTNAIQRMGSPFTTAVMAIRAIGTNAIPTILDWISYEPSPLRKQMAALAVLLPASLRLDSLSLADERANNAIAVFRILGPEARPAIPELSRLMLTSSQPARARRCFGALIHLGPEAMPSVLTLLTNRWPELRVATIYRLTAFGTNAQAATGALRPLLIDPDLEIRVITTNELLRIAPGVLTHAPPQ